MGTRYCPGPLLLIAVVALSSCGKIARPLSDPKPNPPGESSPLIGQTAPDIDGADVDGRRLRLSDYRGQVVVLHFWGHW